MNRVERIVSLLPASTEMVHAVGAGDRLVGRSHECDHPPGVEQLPACTSPRVDLSGTSRETDDRVRHLVRQGSGVYEVDPELLRDLEPDLIITQSQCEVCAVDTETVHRALREALGEEVRIVDLKAGNFRGILDDIRAVAEAVGKKAHGEKEVQRIEGTRQLIRDRVTGLHEPSVAAIEWIDPLMAGGNWIPELLASVGADSVFGQAGEHSPWMEREQLLEADPEFILLMPCGYDIETTRREMKALAEWEEWGNLQAVKEEKVFILEGNQYFNRPGPRIADSLRILAEVLHPERFEPTMEGVGWEKG